MAQDSQLNAAGASQVPMAPNTVESDSSVDSNEATSHSSTTLNGSAVHIRASEVDEDALRSNGGEDENASRLSRETHTRWSWAPQPVRRVTRAVVDWGRGPDPPRIQKITPFFPRWQTAPVRYLDRLLPKRRHQLVLLAAYYFCWLTTFVAVLHHSAFAGDIPGYGAPTRIGCGDSWWADGNGCGLNGNDCRPFDNSSLAFRCPANCRGTHVLNPHAVGTQEIVYQPLVVGGPPAGPGAGSSAVYRGDSFICGSAIHAGVISNKEGGCGVVKLVGGAQNFPSSSQNHVNSIRFDSSFPLAYSFDENVPSQCKDLRWPLLAVSIVYTVLLSIFTVSPAIFFTSIFVGIYFQVGLSSDPPNLGDYYSIVSILLGRFLPGAFVAFVLYRYWIRRTLTGLTAQVEKTILWLGGCWVGGLTNYTFDFIPIQRLTPHDINQQPGAKAALAIIAVCLILVVVGQVWYFRLEGRLPRYLALYIFFCVTLGLFVAIPHLNLRIHHYILAILLTPGTSMQTRPSLLYQGILMGFFINGVARWGFDSILQTPAALQGDAQLGSPLPLISTEGVFSNNITFTWSAPSTAAANANGTFDGVSVLVNDVERYRGFQGYDPQLFTYHREDKDSLPYYFRFAFMQDSSAGDYTKAGTWKADGTWEKMEPGPS